MNNIPVYRSYKTVRAFRIGEIRYVDGSAELPAVMFPVMGGRILVPAEKSIEPVTVDVHWILRHEPQVGGYYVLYGDGYASYSPATAFETGYTRVGLLASASTPEQLVLNALRPDQPIELGELAKRTGLDLAAVRRVVDALL